MNVSCSYVIIFIYIYHRVLSFKCIFVTAHVNDMLRVFICSFEMIPFNSDYRIALYVFQVRELFYGRRVGGC